MDLSLTYIALARKVSISGLRPRKNRALDLYLEDDRPYSALEAVYLVRKSSFAPGGLRSVVSGRINLTDEMHSVNHEVDANQGSG